MDLVREKDTAVASTEITSDGKSWTVTSVEYLALDDNLLLGCSDGTLVRFHPQRGLGLSIEGACDGAIRTMSISPDQELLIVLYQQHDNDGAIQILGLSPHIETVFEHTAEQDTWGAAAPANLGWGSAATQFKGRAGKESAKVASNNTQSDQTPMGQHDDGAPSVVWRGDGEYFAVSTLSPKLGARVIRIWDRAGVLQATSEAVDGLGPTLAWQPSGSLIASSQLLPHRQDIIFFERNGLRHGEFTLPFPRDSTQVEALGWSCDSKVLAIQLSVGEEHRTFLQLWTCSNYHWDLKYQFSFVATEPISGFSWSSEDPQSLCIVSQIGTSESRRTKVAISSTLDLSPGLGAKNLSTVAVIDGAKVRLTALRRAVVPPPMSGCELHITPKDAYGAYPSISEVAFPPSCMLPDGVGILAALVIMDGSARIQVYRWEFDETPTCVAAIELGDTLPGRLRHLCWARFDQSGQSVFTFVSQSSHKADAICAIQCVVPLSRPDAEIPIEAIKPVTKCADLDGYAISLAVEQRIGQPRYAVLGLDNGAFLQFVLEDGIKWVSKSEPWPGIINKGASGRRLCASVALIQRDEQPTPTLLALNSVGQFYVDGVIVAHNCNSFAVHDLFIIFTTYEHKCVFAQNDMTANQLAAAYMNKDSSAILRSRAVERGSHIIAAVPRGTKVVFQMPRGNLEAVWPRPLVLAAVQKLLNSKNYKHAFHVLRRHRISLGVLYDHSPESFEADISQFVLALESTTSLNLFLSELSDQNALQESKIETPGKRDRVCKLIREAVTEIDCDRYLETVVHSHVVSSQNDLGGALTAILAAQQRHGADAQLVTSALKYTAVISKDTRKLYDAALGTYDLDLALMVADIAQQDPKEYLPQLEELSELSPALRRYQIDIRLRRYPSALKNLLDAGSSHDDTFMALASEHKLFELSRKLATEYDRLDLLRHCEQAHAIFLTSNSKYRAAGLLFMKCGDANAALKAFEAGLEWKWYRIVAAKINLPSTELVGAGSRLAVALAAAGRLSEAGEVSALFCDDCETAALYLTQAGAWSEALLLCERHGRKDLIETHVSPAIKLAAESVVSGIHGEGGLIEMHERHRARLAIVRTEKEARTALGSEDEEDMTLDAGLYSDGSSRASSRVRSNRSRSGSSRSNRSRSSANTAMTHRSRRRRELKKTSLREGGEFEEAALLHALSEISKRYETFNAEASPLKDALEYLGLYDAIEPAATALRELFKVLKSAYVEVWSLAQVQRTAVLPDTAAEHEASFSNNVRSTAFMGSESSPTSNREETLRLVGTAVHTICSICVDTVSLEAPPRPKEPTV